MKFQSLGHNYIQLNVAVKKPSLHCLSRCEIILSEWKCN